MLSGKSQLAPVDLLGRSKVRKLPSADRKSEASVNSAAASAFARIHRNHFKFKSLSCWSYNIAVGCSHACRFCYVPSSQHTGVGKMKENTGPVAVMLREHGILDPDAEWGKYVLFRPWDEAAFLGSLKSAENTARSSLNADGNRAIILCSTTDPYQTVVIPGNDEKQKLLNRHCRHLVSRALELILTESTLNVRILTRSPLAVKDFDLFKQFGDRLIFGMSIPTLDDELRKVYEPHAPGIQARLRILRAAAEAGIPIYVAMAPTYPECDEADLRRTLEAIRPLKPLTIFHEPINVRAENVARISKHAKELGMEAKMKPEVFADPASWRRYAIDQLMTVQKVATELGMEDQLHLWPDQSLKSKGAFLRARALLRANSTSGRRRTAHEKQRRSEEDEAAYAEFEKWLAHWHSRISEWPGKK
jgi:DNA repair photolyase